MAAPRIDNLNTYTNLMINGAFDFFQRGTSFAAVANNAYTADRWQHGKAGTMVGTISRSTDVPTVAQSGFASQYSLLYTVTTAQASLGAGDYASLGYKVEGSDYAGIAGGQAARLQFWVKASVAGTYSAALRNNAANRSYVTTVTVSAANTWERKTIDFTTDSSGTWLVDNGIGLILTISLGTGTTFQTNTLNAWQSGNFLAANSQTNLQATNGATFLISQIMLVKGSFPSSSTTLSFQRAGRTIGDELRMCQRYFYGITPTVSGTPMINLVATGTTTLAGPVFFPVTMRSAPTIFTGLTAAAADFRVDDYVGAATNLSSLPTLAYAGVQSATIFGAVASGLTQYRNYELYSSPSLIATLGFTAEL